MRKIIGMADSDILRDRIDPENTCDHINKRRIRDHRSDHTGNLFFLPEDEKRYEYDSSRKQNIKSRFKKPYQTEQVDKKYGGGDIKDRKPCIGTLNKNTVSEIISEHRYEKYNRKSVNNSHNRQSSGRPAVLSTGKENAMPCPGELRPASL